MPVTTLVVSADGNLREDVALSDLTPHLQQKGSAVWVDLMAPTMKDYDELQKVFAFHPLTIEDCHNNIQRPKVEDYGEYLFLVFHGLNLNEGEEPLNMLELDAYLGPNYLVTVRYGRIFSIRDVMERLRKNPGILTKGTDHVYYGIVDRMVDHYFDLMERIDDEVDALEERLFTEIGEEVLQGILDLKRRIMALRRVAGPQREIMNQLARGDFEQIQKGSRYYFRDVYDHLLRIGDSLDAYRDMVGSAMDAYMTQLSNRTNDIMKVLSIIATIMLPLTLITGYFGMNFHRMPFLEDPSAVWYLTGLMLVMAVLMLFYFRRKRWI